VARDVEAALDAYARHRPVERRLDTVPPTLRDAIHRALDALDADPAACPSRRVQLALFASSEEPVPSPPWCSWATVEAFAAFAEPNVLVAQLRMVPGDALRLVRPRPATDDDRLARMLIVLAHMVLPSWEATYPDDDRPRRVIEDAERVLAGGPPSCTELRATLHTEAYEDERLDKGAWIAARVAVWAHSAAVDDGANDEQDTPPDLACAAFKTIAAHGATGAERARVFWERFFLDVVTARS
jgi:hypothetical protein